MYQAGASCGASQSLLRSTGDFYRTQHPGALIPYIPNQSQPCLIPAVTAGKKMVGCVEELPSEHPTGSFESFEWLNWISSVVTQCLNSVTSSQTKSLFSLGKADLWLCNFPYGMEPLVEATHGTSAEFEPRVQGLILNLDSTWAEGWPGQTLASKVNPSFLVATLPLSAPLCLLHSLPLPWD